MMETKKLLPSDRQPQPAPRRYHARSRKLCIPLAGLAAILVIALALGLGIGLTRHHNDSNSDAVSSNSDSDPGSSSSNSTSLVNSTMGIVPSANGVWQPQVNASWQIVLLSPLQLDLTSNVVSPNVDVWDIDMFTNSKETIAHLHALGKRVVCYFSAGSYEPKRPDSAQFADSDKGGELSGWPGEYWLRLNSQSVRNIMANRISYAYDNGCDAIDPDNVDGYSNDENGLGLTKQDAIDYIGFLSDTAAKYNISVGLKNAGAIISDVLDKVHFSVNEQCVQYGECSTYAPFVQASKPVFHIEYPKGDAVNTQSAVASSDQNTVCNQQGKAAGSHDFSTVIKNMDLDGWVQYCNSQQAITPCASSASGPQSY